MDILQKIHDQLDYYLVKASSSFADIDCAIVTHGSVAVLQTSLLSIELETPFSQLNVDPGPHDLALINVIISEQNTQISTLSLQMQHVDTAIQKLATIRAELEENCAHVRRSLLAHRALTSPARRIPPEVLGEVFYHCLPKTPYITPRDVESPMMLARVCRRWRAVAMSTPRLWSSLSINLDKAVCDMGYRHGCESWLARAKSVPLTLRVLNDIHLFTEDLVASVVHWLKPLIAQSSDLWWHGPSLPNLFAPEPGTDLPLRHLRITTHRDAPAVHFPSPAKRLRSVSLQCFSFDLRSLNGIDLPWDDLVDLNMHFALFSSTLFVQILARCGSLHTLVVSSLSADENQLGVLRALPPGSITHPLLRRIEIKVIRSGIDVILGALTLPALEELDVCFCYRERDPWPHAAFVAMLDRSRCALKRLTVRSNKTALPYFGEYVEAIPGLVVSTSALCT